MAPKLSMTAISWNCRGLRGPSTISQLKESIRNFQPGLVFLCETKNKKGFLNSVGRKLGFGARWKLVEPLGKSGGSALGWSEDVTTEFCMDVEYESRWWGIFGYFCLC